MGVIPTRYAGTIDIGELTKPPHKDAPPILRLPLRRRRAPFFPFWLRHHKALEVMDAAVDRKTVARSKPLLPARISSSRRSTLWNM